ncbi:hypothetical protein ILUMI_00960 [Ignelater luminosus]|uniref:Uncharacterized protein n=1 Tax=Ignelater luminosus TaxID=2038154 RepID=A0A8K0GMN7_IGNLU|nr:hypothetical protein ILUMI_00960 [Ignelater luminosus]
MPQGKLKVKTQLPKNVKNKKDAKKGPAISKRANCPIQPKKKKLEESQKIKQNLTKALNKAVEEEMRSRAYEGTKKLSKAEEAVVAHSHNATQQSSST